MTENRICRKCEESFPLDKDHFGHMPSGGFRWTCRECVRKKVSDHTKNNPDMAEKRFKKRKAQELAVGSNYDKEALRVLLRRDQKGLCFYCKDSVDGIGELDHARPIVKGGLDTPINIVLACTKCNKEKHNKSVEEYREWLAKNKYEVRF